MIGPKDDNENKDVESRAPDEDDNVEDEGEDESNEDMSLIDNAFQSKYDVVTLPDQRKSEEQLIGQINPPTMYVTYYSSSRRGVAILINKPHRYLKGFCWGGDYAWVYVEIDGQKYTFMSVYYHPTEKADLMDNMSTLLTTESEAFRRMLVIGGDFNTTLHPTKDAKNENPVHRERRERLRQLMNRVNLSDVWREWHSEQKFTYSCNEPVSRIDYVFMLKEDLVYVQRCEIDYTINLSDHFPVTLTLKTDDDDGNLSKVFINLKV